MAWQTITLEEWRRWQAIHDRNLTDSPIGATTAGKRQTDAVHSQAVTDGDGFAQIPERDRATISRRL